MRKKRDTRYDGSPKPRVTFRPNNLMQKWPETIPIFRAKGGLEKSSFWAFSQAPYAIKKIYFFRQFGEKQSEIRIVPKERLIFNAQKEGVFSTLRTKNAFLMHL